MGKRYEALLSSASAHAAHTMSAFQPQSVVCILFVAFHVALISCLAVIASVSLSH